MKIEEYMEYGRAACEASVKAGAGQSEAWLQRDRSITITVENNEVRGCEVKDDAGWCMRAITKGAVGYARGMGMDPGSIAAAGRDAAALASAAQPDPDFVSLPQPGEIPEVPGLFDPRVDALTVSDALPWARDCIAAAKDANPDVALKADVTVVSGACAVVNSLGVSASERYTFASIDIFAVVRRGDDVGSYYDFTRVRKLSDMKPHTELAIATVRKAETFLGARKIESAVMPVLLGPLAAFSFLHSIAGAAEAEGVLRGRSFLAGKKGGRIAPEIINIEEDPLCEAGMYSSPFDAEGCPKSRRALVSDGVLTGYLHNSTTASRAKEPLTGHAERAGYLSGVGIGLTNISVRPGAAPESELMASMNNGLYVAMGSLAPNPVSGAVSGTIDYGFIVEGGKPAGAVSNAMLGGDVFELLNRIEAVSSDFRREPGNIMPSLLIGGVSVAS